jgi:hypothetical protein
VVNNLNKSDFSMDAADRAIEIISTNRNYEKLLTEATLNTGTMNPSSVYWSTAHGVNLTSTQTPTQVAKEHSGYTFFVKPTMNLSYDNVRNSRLLIPIATSQDPSWMSMWRCYLDSFAHMGYGMQPTISSKLVNPKSPFISILSNELVSINGFPDRVIDIFQTQEGRHREATIMADGIYDISNVYSLNATFKLLPGNPILYGFCNWLCYMALVHEGIVNPYYTNDVQNRLDYTTSIFRIMVDETKQRVVRFGRTGYAIPTNCPEGAAYNYEANSPFSSASSQIDIQFTCCGWVTNDVGYILDFNRLQLKFNPRLGAAVRPRISEYYVTPQFPDLYHDSQFGMVKLDPYFFNLFTTDVYPWINIQDGWTLERWVSSEDFTRILDASGIKDFSDLSKRHKSPRGHEGGGIKL